jgi:hypothetical protein
MIGTFGLVTTVPYRLAIYQTFYVHRSRYIIPTNMFSSIKIDDRCQVHPRYVLYVQLMYVSCFLFHLGDLSSFSQLLLIHRLSPDSMY